MNLVRTPFRWALSVSVMLPVIIRAKAGISRRRRPRPGGQMGGADRAPKGAEISCLLQFPARDRRRRHH
jgi:hypothetical protein